MAAFINGIGMISPQKTAETEDFLTEIVETEANYLKCVEPVYRNYIDPMAARRMSRLIKMGISSAKMCIADAGNVQPDAIITATGLGSVEDTERILETLKNNEDFFNPTPFIQSTYNTISSQIAITLKCHGYNSTYVHRTFSFESGLQDALMQIMEQKDSGILIGGIDEMTLNHLLITRRAGHWKMNPVNNLRLLQYDTPGALAGEGSAYFMLSGKREPGTYSQLKAVSTFYSPKADLPLKEKISEFLASIELEINDIDLVLLGFNGDNRLDPVYTDLLDTVFPGSPAGYYKHLCGEYHTSSGFALWLAANMLKRQSVPAIIKLNEYTHPSLKNILIYNNYLNINHSLILVTV